MNLHDVLQKELKEFPLYSQESEKDPKVLVTFELIGFWIWHFIEYDPESKRGFAFVQGFENELGYVYIPELLEIMESEKLLSLFTLHKSHMNLSTIKKGL